MKEVPFLSVKEVNKIDDYERFYHSKVYLKQKAEKLKYFKNQRVDLHKLAKKSGYKNFNKFIRRRKSWHSLERKIPLAYLDAIGAEIDVLKFTVELDIKDYEKVLEMPLYPRYYMRKMAPLMVSFTLPEGLSEEDAIQFLKELERNKMPCYIYYPGIKMIIVQPDEKVSIKYYKPGITITNEYLVPTYSGTDIGKVYLA